jgi:hypothetical protein
VALIPEVWLNRQAGGSVISNAYQNMEFGTTGLAEVTRFVINLAAYTHDIVLTTMLPFTGQLGRLPVLFLLVDLTVLALITLGFVRSQWWREAAGLYVLLYLVAVIHYQDPGSPVMDRYVIPVMPFLGATLIQGSIWLGAKMNLGARLDAASIALAAACLLGLVFVGENIQNWRHPIREQITDLSLGNAWIAEHAPPSAVLLSPDPVSDYLYAHRRTVGYPDAGADLGAYLRAHQVSYILVAPSLHDPKRTTLDPIVQAIVPKLAARPDSFHPVYEDAANNVTVYQVMPAAQVAANAGPIAITQSLDLVQR